MVMLNSVSIGWPALLALISRALPSVFISVMAVSEPISPLARESSITSAFPDSDCAAANAGMGVARDTGRTEGNDLSTSIFAAAISPFFAAVINDAIMMGHSWPIKLRMVVESFFGWRGRPAVLPD